MAKERGWWKLDLGEMRSDDLSDCDREHIAQLIIEGFSSGEICKDEIKDTLNTIDGDYGIFVYAKDTDECLITYYTDNKEEALVFAEDLRASENQFNEETMYMEVWENDEDSLWGSCGAPLYKSDAV